MGNVHFPASFRSILELIQNADDIDSSNQLNSSIYRRAHNRHRNRGYALREVGELSELIFLKMFRLSRTGFDQLLDILSPFMHDTNEAFVRISSGLDGAEYRRSSSLLPSL